VPERKGSELHAAEGPARSAPVLAPAVRQGR
jgi:hypothetical protein